MASKTDLNDPSQTSAAWDEMAPKWARVETLLAGTDAMRESAEVYLPRHDVETSANYHERLARATLFNMTELTLNNLVGKPFSHPVEMDESVPPEILALASDIDQVGTTFHSFCRAWFREGLAKGLAHVYVDMPPIESEVVGIRTVADDAREGRRPFWSLIRPENVIAAHSEVVDGRERLTHVRIVECDVSRVGFAEVYTKRIRVVEPEMWRLYEERRTKRRKAEWVVIAEGENSIGEVPLVTFYTDRRGLMLTKPPLDDLTHLNVRHWQSVSDQISIITVARFPMLAVGGATDSTGTVMAIGPRQILGTRDPNGRFYYVEHTGAAIDAGRQDLMDIEEMMANYGAQFLKRRPGGTVATARALDSAEAVSPLQDYVLRFKDTVGDALDLTARWMGLEEGGGVTIATDFGPSAIETMDLRALLEARRNRDLSRETFLIELRRRGLLSDDFEPKSEVGKILAEEEIPSPFAPVARNTTLEDGGNDGVGTGRSDGRNSGGSER